MDYKKLNEALDGIKKSLSEEVNVEQIIKDLEKIQKQMHVRVFVDLANSGDKKLSKKASTIIKMIGDLRLDVKKIK